MQVKLLFYLFVLSTASEQQLKQVVILSRHNVRTPLAKNLEQMTPKSWPEWKEKNGYLTEKGVLLEGFMGKWFAAWLYTEGLLPAQCPNEEDIFVYANVKQRTIASARAFVESGFPNCNITIHHNQSDNNDPIFNPVLHNTSSIFRQIAIEEMHERLKSLHLNMSYEDVETILDYKDSEFCKVDKKCDLTIDKNKIINVVPGKKPNILGPLKIGNSAIDAFIMEYYQGFPFKNVAWGLLSNTKQWRTIMNLSRAYHDVIFNTTLVSKDIAMPLLKYMSGIFLKDAVTPKVTLLMGHDANIYTIVNSMRFKPYSLKNQFELTPVGGKIVFQKWLDKETDTDLLKINYVYSSRKQMRDGIEFSLKNPPEFIVLQLEDCKIDLNGFCLWDDFVKLLNNL